MDALLQVATLTGSGGVRQPTLSASACSSRSPKREMVLRAARALLHEMLERVWARRAPRTCGSGDPGRFAGGPATYATASAARAVDLIYSAVGVPHCSLATASARLARHPHLHAACRVRADWYQPVGRVLLGREADAAL